jgi:hypothetical protein
LGGVCRPVEATVPYINRVFPLVKTSQDGSHGTDASGNLAKYYNSDLLVATIVEHYMADYILFGTCLFLLRVVLRALRWCV